jgi:hypothetical protein
LPKLDVMTVDQILGGLDGRGVVYAIQMYRFEKVAVPVDPVGSIIGHVTHPPQIRREHAKLSVTDNSRAQCDDISP